MSKETALVNLLTELFSSPESLKRFVYSMPIDSSEIPSVQDEGSTERLALWFCDELRRRGLVDANFFGRLLEVRPDSAKRIQEVQNQWLVEVETWIMPPTVAWEQARRGKAATVLVSYARYDTAFFEELSNHLALLQRKGVIELWHEGRIQAGEAWDKVIKRQIQRAEIFILLVSPDFLSSDFVWEHELPRVLERQRQGKAAVIPVIVRPCLWQDSPIASLQVLPSDGKPVAVSTNPDRTWISVAREVEQVARQVRQTK